MGRYVDFQLISKYPNKYDLTPKSIKQLKILDWDRLKQECWYNSAMNPPSWCHTEGCQDVNKTRYVNHDEFWIGFQDNGTIDCSFSSYDGMCKYIFDTFYQSNSIENRWDMNVQVNTIKWLNKMIDEGILRL